MAIVLRAVLLEAELAFLRFAVAILGVNVALAGIMSDPIWQRLRDEAVLTVKHEPALAPLLEDTVLNQNTLEEGLCVRLSRKLGRHSIPPASVYDICFEAMSESPTIGLQVRRDIEAICERDPACTRYMEPFLFFKGFLAITAHRVAHHLWGRDRRCLALYIQSLVSEEFAVDIHPAAKIGCGILLDHATSFVMGETGLLEDNVSILHEVTLGGTGKELGDRHPKVRSGVLIGAGAKLLGNIEIGTGAKIGAGSVVLSDVPAHTTVAGVPAKVVGQAKDPSPALCMDHHLD